MPFSKSCETCGLLIDNTCAGHTLSPKDGKDIYGLSYSEVSKLFPNGCEDWELSFTLFCKAVNGQSTSV